MFISENVCVECILRLYFYFLMKRNYHSVCSIFIQYIQPFTEDLRNREQNIIFCFYTTRYWIINILLLIIILTVHEKSLGFEYYLKNKLYIDSTKQIWIELRNPSFISQTLIKSNLNSVFPCKGKYLMLRSGPLRQLSSCCLGVGHMKRSTAGIKRWG